MSIQTSGTPYDQRQRLTAQQVREATFERLPLGRRGLDETEVLAFLERIAEEIATRDAELNRLIDENRRLKHAVREWHRRQEGYDPAELLARAQQQVDAQIAQAEEYSREREEEATRLYDQIVNEARERARAEAQAELGSGNGGRRIAGGGDGNGPSTGRLSAQREQGYVNGLLQALDALAAHVDATRQAFTLEVDRLDSRGSPAATNALDGPAALRSPTALGPADAEEGPGTVPRPDTTAAPPGDDDAPPHPETPKTSRRQHRHRHLARNGRGRLRS